MSSGARCRGSHLHPKNRSVIARAFVSFVLVSIFALASVSIVSAAAGDADPWFGGAGYIRYSAPKVAPGLVGAILGLDDGSVVVAGGADSAVFVQHRRVDGSLDESFGSNGTSIVPGLSGDGRPSLHLFRDVAGRILVEQDGTVRRLLANGTFDATYLPARMDVVGRVRGYNLLPLADGRFVIVSGLQGFPTRPPLSVRFYLADGTPDVSRGGPSGERLIYPSGNEGTFNEATMSAVVDANGRILIAARWDRNTSDISLVLIRLNQDGSDDATFGQNGVVVIGSHLGNVNSPQVRIGRDGRIAYLFDAPVAAGADPYFVIYVLSPNGQPDTSLPSGGRIAVVVPRAAGPAFELRLVSGPPSLAVIGVAPIIAAPALMLWRADPAASNIGPPVFTSNGFVSNQVISAVALAADRLWVGSLEDPFTYGNPRAPFYGYGRGALMAFDTESFATTPTRVVISLNSHFVETFTDAKRQSDGSIVVLESYFSERQVLTPTLKRFTADGRIDPSFGVIIATGDNLSNTIVPSKNDATTVLRWSYFCGLNASSCLRAGLMRFTKDGLRDPSFGINGAVTVANGVSGGFDLERGFVDADNAVNLVQVTAGGPTSSSVLPLRFTASGADPDFHASSQAIPDFAQGTTRLDALPDGRLQSISVGGGNRRLAIHVLRWHKNGAIDPSMPAPTSFFIGAADGSSTARDVDTLVLPDGRTLVAIDEASQRIVLRLRSDGTLDTTFGSGGTARVDGVSGPPVASKLAVGGDGKILLAYNTKLGQGTALTVARFTGAGQRDQTFTADNRFDSLFSLGAIESASDLIALPDGGILAVGQSGDHGLLLRLKGNDSPVQVTTMPVVEFFNTLLDHYFITSAPGEIIATDTGAAGPGWERTGLGFRAFTPATAIPPGALPVCRFYGTPGRGPNSHFYTMNPDECAAVKRDPGWTYEGIAFHAYAPVNDQCSGSVPVYRAYNNGFARNDSNHRYSTQLSFLQSMTLQGWTVEGVAFCSAAI